MIISAIVAISDNHVIGKNNQLPWHMPADLQHFKRVTMGKPIIMGRKTFESIGKPLPGRQNIVISTQKDYSPNGCITVNSIEAALDAVKNTEEVFVIGGAAIFEMMLPKIQRLYLTKIHQDFAGDAFFPRINPSEWNEVACEHHAADDNNPYPYSFMTLTRKEH